MGIVDEFISALKTDTDQTPNKTYSAVVSKIDDEGVAWVYVAGSDKETPTASTSSEIKRGDAVNVEWRNNKLYIAGNYSNPSAGTTRVTQVETAAEVANIAATQAVSDASMAKDAAEQAQASASDAATAATNAHNAAVSAQNSADTALVSLSTVQDVVGVLNWITAHGTMTPNGNTALDPSKVYFVRDANGDYEVGSYHYSIVSEPKAEDRTNYYTLSVDESVQNYVAVHLAVTSEGLWLIPDSGGNKVLIATGAGTTYTTAGTYIIGKVNNIDTVFAKFTAEGAQMLAEGGIQIAHLGYGTTITSGGGTDEKPYYTLGTRKSGTSVGIYSMAEGEDVEASSSNTHAEGLETKATRPMAHAEGWVSTASGQSSHAEGEYTIASGLQSHAEGDMTRASGVASHAEGSSSRASGDYSHAQNQGTKASSANQTALGKYNIEDSNGTYAVILGNGTSTTPSNALTIDWSGNVVASGTISDSSGALSRFITDTYSSGTVSWSAGTVGTRAVQVSKNISKTGYTPVAVSITYVSSSTAFLPVAFFSSDRATLYLNFYRADASAHSDVAGMTALVLYQKS